MVSENRRRGIRIPGLAQITPLLAVMTDVFWSYTVLALVSQFASAIWSQPPLSLLSCLALAVFTEVVVRASLAGQWSARRVRWVVLPTVFIFLALLIRLNLGGGYAFLDAGWLSFAGNQISAIVVALLFGLFLIWRGITTGRGENTFGDLYRRFVIGLVMIILVLIFWRFYSGPTQNIWETMGIEIILFFGTGLLAMAVANLESLRYQLAQHQEGVSSFSRRWLTMLIVMVLGIIGLGVAAVSIFSSGTGEALVHLLGILGNWLIIAITYILYPVGFIAAGLYYVARWIIGLLRGDIAPPEFEASGPMDWSKMLQGQTESQIPEALLLVLKWGAVAIFIGFVIYFLARLLTRYWQGKSEEGVEEVHEALGTWKMFRNDLRSVLAWLFGWLRRRKTQTGDGLPTPAWQPPDAEQDRILSIRELYQSLLWQGKEMGIPRRPTETPYEYSRRLNATREGVTEEVNNLTEAYIFERYGQINPTPEKVTWLNRLWRNLKEKFVKADEEI